MEKIQIKESDFIKLNGMVSYCDVRQKNSKLQINILNKKNGEWECWVYGAYSSMALGDVNGIRIFNSMSEAIDAVNFVLEDLQTVFIGD